MIAGEGERADDQDAGQPGQAGDERRAVGQHVGPAEQLVAQAGIGGESRDDRPPGHDGVHPGAQQPGSGQQPDFLRLLAAGLRREQARQAGEIDGTEGHGQDARPGGDAQGVVLAQQGRQGVFSGGEVEDLKGDQRGEQDQAQPQAARRDLPLPVAEALRQREV